VYSQRNEAGMRAMLSAPFMVEAMRKLAEMGMARAEEIAPVRTGRYLSRFQVQAGVRNGKAYAVWFNDVRSPAAFPYSVALEIGTKYMRRQRIIARSMDAVKTANLH
jgi:hypothetical protein